MRRLPLALLLCGLLSIVGVWPVVAQSTAPSPALSPGAPPWLGGRAEMPEYGFAVTVPDGWIAFDLTGDIDAQARSALAVLAPTAPEEEIQAYVDGWRAYQEQSRGQVVVTDDRSSCTFVVGPASDDLDLDLVANQFYVRQTSDDSVTHAEPPAIIILTAGPTRLLTYGRSAEEVALYLAQGNGLLVNAACFGEERPDDDWVSVVDTFEWLAEGG